VGSGLFHHGGTEIRSLGGEPPDFPSQPHSLTALQPIGPCPRLRLSAARFCATLSGNNRVTVYIFGGIRE
jgi:hypothetical protein